MAPLIVRLVWVCLRVDMQQTVNGVPCFCSTLDPSDPPDPDQGRVESEDGWWMNYKKCVPSAFASLRLFTNVSQAFKKAFPSLNEKIMMMPPLEIKTYVSLID